MSIKRLENGIYIDVENIRVLEDGVYTDSESIKVPKDNNIFEEVYPEVKQVYLYKEGNECTNITGGWIGKQFDSSFQNGYYTKGSTYLEFGDNSYSYGYGGFITNKAIDLTKYSKLYVDMQLYYYVTESIYSATCNTHLSNVASPNIRVNNSFFGRSVCIDRNTTRQTLVMNIADISKALWISVDGRSGAYGHHQAKCKLYNMWLET